MGEGAAILDASPFHDRGVAGNGLGVHVLAANVQVRDLTFRNGGTGVQVDAAGARLERLRFTGTDFAVMVGFEGSNLLVASSDFDRCGIGITGDAPDTTVRRNVFRNVGIVVDLDAVDADRAQILENRIEGGFFGIFSGADDTVVRSNHIRNVTQFGISIFGDNPIVENNTVTGGGFGIIVNCMHEPVPGQSRPGICDRASVAWNTVRGANDYAFMIATTGIGTVVHDNLLSDSGLGMSLNGGLGATERNRAQNIGRDLDGHCFESFLGGQTFADNTARECANAGLYANVIGSIVRNRITDTAENGITLDGALPGLIWFQPPVVDNVSQRNAAQGLAIINGVYQATISGNVATENRTDFCDEGQLTIVSGNTFGTVGPCAVLH